ncbi:MAG: DUF4340 domain-containing protein [Roseburia sp.]|nr:DUF4340 domain-containing protein [Roseburia sp.]
MKKQKIQIITLLAAVVLLCAAYAGIRYYNNRQEEKEAEKEKAETITVTDFEVSDITKFSYQLEGQTLSFTKEGENWHYDGDSSVDIDEDAVETLLSKAVNVTAEETVTEYDTLADFGLETPSNTITITTEEGNTTLFIGNQNEITNQYYLKKADSDIIYLVGSAVATGFNKTVEDLTAEEEETETEEIPQEESTQTEETTEEIPQEESSETEEIPQENTETE